MQLRFLLCKVCFLLIIPCSAILAEQQREDFFIAPFGEISGYGWDGNNAIGGGLMIGAGTGGALGLSVSYAVDAESSIFLELLFFLRVYIFGADAISGPFLQLSAGPVIYAYTSPQITNYGNISAGITTGWRFLLGRHFFIEPAFRIGFPYLAAASMAVGVRR